ncbi:MAG: RagB/SusD family nutrient uptake outer membrane protein [Candidatus Pedobacter colombiensis]|uniref:RagB/SusD family nutrient uptake outer membrane protein n=1 Tax=Candidatus Pedobacter colombiensis TaxID=3121371 RepID=A0AAJ5WAR0_9SPHI|nr:RagB/SusD family nutrient uptake outer membrane protein [Pedobacter sp.]WEK20155.1 MAG: RagB/SusD family nutrient uptake outer membrane protein [Pedobacter sp.]
MNKNLSITFTKYLLVVLGLSTMLSCKKTFDIKPQDALEPSQMYRNVYDADATILGIYGKFVGLADRYILLNELRADLLDVTGNANAYLKQLGTQTVAADNPYADPKPFYEVIINCNDALKNFNIMRDKKLLDNNQYYQRYTDILFLRSWLYLQLGIHYGNVPYVTDALTNIDDLKDESKFQKIPFEELLMRLIAETEATPREFLNQNTAEASPTLIVPMDTYVIKDGVFKFFIQRRSLLGDLHLWKGNYLKAATYYKDVMETGTNLSNNSSQQVDLYDTYRVGDDNSTDHSLKTTAVLNPWTRIFTGILSDKIPNWERMWTLPFSGKFSPGNPLLSLFSASGNYLVKPAILSINNWNNQIRLDGSLTDRRGLNMSYRLNGGQPEVLKYTQNYSSLLPFEKTGIWILYRAAILHLRYAEAANRLDRTALAGALINSGIKAKFGTKSTYNGAPDIYPFDFNGDGGTIRGNWYRNSGIRGRAVNQDVPILTANAIVDTEDKIIQEEALETAFEGYRWQDLLRIALRRHATDPNYLADKIAAKFEAAGDGASAAIARSRLTNQANWYLPFKIK